MHTRKAPVVPPRDAQTRACQLAEVGDSRHRNSMASFTRNALCIVAVTLLSSIAASSPASAQVSSRTADGPDSLATWYRDPHTAQILGSFLPGAGHFYAGEKLRGLGLGGAAVVGIASG